MAQVTPTGHQVATAPGGVRNSKTRIVASILGILAGLLGLIYGYLETLQGNVAPRGIIILVMGPPCQANRVWHDCYPATLTHIIA
jgi:hypothetical protein